MSRPHRILAAWCGGLAMLAAASPAAATTLIRPDGTPWGGTWQRWADQSLLPTPAGQVTFVPDRCPAYREDPESLGCAYLDQRVVYARRDHPQRRLTLLHELGHLVEHEQATDQERAAWAASQGLAWGELARERFANAYADCARWLAPSWWPARTCSFIRSIAERA